MTSVPIMRAPVAPNGWPSAVEPPFGFSRLRGNFPKSAFTPALSRMNSARCIVLRDHGDDGRWRLLERQQPGGEYDDIFFSPRGRLTDLLQLGNVKTGIAQGSDDLWRDRRWINDPYGLRSHANIFSLPLSEWLSGKLYYLLRLTDRLLVFYHKPPRHGKSDVAQAASLRKSATWPTAAVGPQAETHPVREPSPCRPVSLPAAEDHQIVRHRLPRLCQQRRVEVL